MPRRLRVSPGAAARLILVMTFATGGHPLADEDADQPDRSRRRAPRRPARRACRRDDHGNHGNHHANDRYRERVAVLIKLLRTYLRPYKRPIRLVVLFQLRADARDPLPARRSTPTSSTTAWSPATPATSCASAASCSPSRSCRSLCAIGRRLLRRPHRDGPRPRHARGHLRPGADVLGARGRPVRRAVADHPHHQRRAAGADARADDVHADGDRRRSCASAASSWRCGRTCRCRRCCWSSCRCWSCWCR